MVPSNIYDYFLNSYVFCSVFYLQKIMAEETRGIFTILLHILEQAVLCEYF